MNTIGFLSLKKNNTSSHSNVFNWFIKLSCMFWQSCRWNTSVDLLKLCLVLYHWLLMPKGVGICIYWGVSKWVALQFISSWILLLEIFTFKILLTAVKVYYFLNYDNLYSFSLHLTDTLLSHLYKNTNCHLVQRFFKLFIYTYRKEIWYLRNIRPR